MGLVFWASLVFWVFWVGVLGGFFASSTKTTKKSTPHKKANLLATFIAFLLGFAFIQGILF